MKKMCYKLMALMTALIFVLCCFTGCGKNGSSDKIKVTFMNGEETLGTAEVASGKTLTEDDYSKYEKADDNKFMGWFETPTFLDSSKKDLSKDTFTKDTVLYGNFMSDKVTKDSSAWYIAGTSKTGILQKSNWAADADDATKKSLELKATGKNTNEFAITLDLYKEDQFQIIHDWKWDDQKGFGCITTVDTSMMESAGGLAGTSDKSNVNVLKDGNYTITLTTNPDNASQDTITVVRNSDPKVAAAAQEKYTFTDNSKIKVKGSWVADWSDLKELTKESGKHVYTISMDLKADTELCFMVFEGDKDTSLVLKEENVKDDASKAFLNMNGKNIKIKADGTYKFTVDGDAMTVTITK